MLLPPETAAWWWGVLANFVALAPVEATVIVILWKIIRPLLLKTVRATRTIDAFQAKFTDEEWAEAVEMAAEAVKERLEKKRASESDLERLAREAVAVYEESLRVE